MGVGKRGSMAVHASPQGASNSYVVMTNENVFEIDLMLDGTPALMVTKALWIWYPTRTDSLGMLIAAFPFPVLSRMPL